MEEKIGNNSTDKTDSQTTLKELKEKIRKDILSKKQGVVIKNILSIKAF